MNIIEHILDTTVIDDRDDAVDYLDRFYTPNHVENFAEWLGVTNLDSVTISQVVDYNDFHRPGGYDRGQLYRIEDHEVWIFHSPADPLVITDAFDLCSTCSNFKEIQGLLEALNVDDPNRVGVQITGTTAKWCDDDEEVEASCNVTFMGSRGEVKIHFSLRSFGCAPSWEKNFRDTNECGSTLVDDWVREHMISVISSFVQGGG